MTTLPQTPQRPQGQAYSNQRLPLTLAQIVDGHFYSVQFVFPEFVNDPSPLQNVPSTCPGDTPTFDVVQMRTRKQNGVLSDRQVSHARICLVVSVENGHVILLLASSQPRTTYAGTEHRWLPFEGSPRLPLQPPAVVKTLPAAAFTNTAPTASKPYLCFTHALRVQLITPNAALPAAPTPGNGAFKYTQGVPYSRPLLKCLNINNLWNAHEAYWKGVRYGVDGLQRSSGSAPSGGSSGDGPAPSDGSSGDGPAPSGGSSGDGPAPSDGSSGDGPAPSGGSSGDGPVPSDEGSGMFGNVKSRRSFKRKISGDHGPVYKNAKLAVTIEDIDFLPPPKRKSYKGWVKDEDVFMSREDTLRIIRSITSDPEAELGVYPDGYWEPIESESDEEDMTEAGYEAMITDGQANISAALSVTFGAQMAEEPVPKQAMLFPLSGVWEVVA